MRSVWVFRLILVLGVGGSGLGLKLGIHSHTDKIIPRLTIENKKNISVWSQGGDVTELLVFVIEMDL